MSTIALAPDHGLRPWVGRRNVASPRCWCGQDLEHVRGQHCPRCGSWNSSLGSQLGSDLGSASIRPGVPLPALSGRP